VTRRKDRLGAIGEPAPKRIRVLGRYCALEVLPKGHGGGKIRHWNSADNRLRVTDYQAEPRRFHVEYEIAAINDFERYYEHGNAKVSSYGESLSEAEQRVHDLMLRVQAGVREAVLKTRRM
jgi:hypothetical protein